MLVLKRQVKRAGGSRTEAARLLLIRSQIFRKVYPCGTVCCIHAPQGGWVAVYYKIIKFIRLCIVINFSCLWVIYSPAARGQSSLCCGRIVLRVERRVFPLRAAQGHSPSAALKFTALASVVTAFSYPREKPACFSEQTGFCRKSACLPFAYAKVRQTARCDLPPDIRQVPAGCRG